MSGAIAWNTAAASAASWCRHVYQDSGKPWHSTTGGPAPCSAIWIWMPFASTVRRVKSAGIAPSVNAGWAARRATHPHRSSASLPRGGIGQDHFARLVLVRPQHRLALAVAEIVDAGAFDVLELNSQDLRGRPFALVAEFDVADDSLKGVGADVVGELVLVEALGALDGLGEDLHPGKRPRTEVIAE